MLRFTRYILVLIAALLLTGCIKNDIPLPYISGDITAFEVSGQLEVDINRTRREVTVRMADTANLKRVELLRIEASNDAQILPVPEKYLDLSSDYQFTLTTYQDYVWTIKASQEITRSALVDNQMGEAIIDVTNKSVLIQVPTSQSLSDITVRTLQLGPPNAVTDPDPSSVTDFTRSKVFTVTYHDIVEKWTVRIIQTDVEIETKDADAWAKFAYLSGTFVSGSGDPTFEYRLNTASGWSRMPTSDIEVTGGSFTAKLTGLEPRTTYAYRSVVGDLYGDVKTFTTESIIEVPNLSFDDWYQDGKTWYPSSQSDFVNGTRWWDSGNRGANMFNDVNPTSPVESSSEVVRGKAARLASTTVVGQFAAGSIFLGEFLKASTNPLGGELSFGRPYTSRPTQLKGYYNYSSGIINKSREAYSYLEGTQDSCHIYILLADWNAPYDINTATGQLIDFKNDDKIIGMGQLATDESTSGYQPFTINIEYRSSRKPNYLILVASCSRYGDYFTGSTSSVLYLDEFELGWD